MEGEEDLAYVDHVEFWYQASFDGLGMAEDDMMDLYLSPLMGLGICSLQ